MATLTPDIAAHVASTCTTNLAEIEAAWARGLDTRPKLAVGQPGSVDLDTMSQWLGGGGLAVVLILGDSGAVFVIPEDSGALPAWYSAPDPTGQSKLTTLAQELGMLLLPEQYMPDDFKASHVKSLHGAVARGGVASGAALIPIQLELEGKQATAALIWPATRPSAVIGAAAVKPKPAPAPAAKPAPAPKPKAAAKPPARVVPKPRATEASLPTYARSLLRIKVPVIVTLAQKRQPLGRVIELGPGSIIQFDKSCEEMLELDVGGRRVATGEAVKVGDKFGLRITSVVLPDERFGSIKPGSVKK